MCENILVHKIMKSKQKIRLYLFFFFFSFLICSLYTCLSWSLLRKLFWTVRFSDSSSVYTYPSRPFWIFKPNWFKGLHPIGSWASTCWAVEISWTEIFKDWELILGGFWTLTKSFGLYWAWAFIRNLGLDNKLIH